MIARGDKINIRSQKDFHIIMQNVKGVAGEVEEISWVKAPNNIAGDGLVTIGLSVKFKETPIVTKTKSSDEFTISISSRSVRTTGVINEVIQKVKFSQNVLNKVGKEYEEDKEDKKNKKIEIPEEFMKDKLYTFTGVMMFDEEEEEKEKGKIAATIKGHRR